MAVEPTGVALIGGGRWARQLASVVLTGGRLRALCSPSDPERWRHWLAERVPAPGRDVQVATSTGELWLDSQVSHVVIARAARDHVSTTLAALAAGRQVFVEKPFALNSAEARVVVDAARGQVCVTGLVCLFASNLRRFFEAAAALGPADQIEIEWADAEREVRHGEVKRYDVGLSVVQDVFSHIWSLIQMARPGAALELESVSVLDGGRAVSIELLVPDARVPVHVRVNLARGASRRRRHISMSGPGGEASIDFSREPGEAVVNNLAVDVGRGFTSPLAAELAHFLALEPAQCERELNSVHRAVAAIALTERAMDSVRRAQSAQLTSGLSAGATAAETSAARFALAEWVAAAIGGGASPEVLDAVELWLRGGEQAAPVPPALWEDPHLREARGLLQGPA